MLRHVLARSRKYRDVHIRHRLTQSFRSASKKLNRPTSANAAPREQVETGRSSWLTGLRSWLPPRPPPLLEQLFPRLAKHLGQHPRQAGFVLGVRWTIAAGLAWHIICEYFFSQHWASGISMLPTIAAEGDVLWISKYYRRGRGLGVGDVVSFHSPVEPGVYAVKRVIGMPGDFVLRGTPDVDGMMLQVPTGHCWVVGDNLSYSRDSRIWGPLPLALVTGKVVRAWEWAGWGYRSKPLNIALQDAVLDEDDEDGTD